MHRREVTTPLFIEYYYQFVVSHMSFSLLKLNVNPFKPNGLIGPCPF